MKKQIAQGTALGFLLGAVAITFWLLLRPPAHPRPEAVIQAQLATPFSPSRVEPERTWSWSRVQVPAVPKQQAEQVEPQPIRMGKLAVIASPWAEVYVDGKLLATTPVPALDVAVGRHQVRLRYPPSEQEKTCAVEVTLTGKPASCEAHFGRGAP